MRWSLLAVLIVLTAQNTASQAPPTPEQWRADIHQLVAHIEERHRNPWHSVSRDDFHQAVGDLTGRVGTLPQWQIVTELARLVAMIGDGHTRLTLPVNTAHLGFQLGHTPDPDPAGGIDRFHTLPVRFGDFAEGVFVTSATRAWQRLVGMRVVEVAGQHVDTVVAHLAPWVPHDSRSALRRQSVTSLAIPEVLAAAGVGGVGTAIALTLAGRDGRLERVRLPALPYDATPEWEHPAGVPISGPPGPYFALERRGSLLLVRIHQINDSPTEPIGRFARRMAAALSQYDPERVVLDLRLCHGGDQTLSRALVLPLIRWPGATQLGRLFVLVGPETFSAAVNLASRLEEWTQATFVGEPPGSGPSHYSSSDREVLDQSGLVVRVSTGYFVGWTGTEWRESIDIGLPVRPSIDDYLAGEDTALDAVLAYAPAPDVAAQLIAEYERAGINAALIAWLRYRTDPATAHLPLAEAGNALAGHLLDTGATRYAAAVYLYTREFYPDVLESYLGEAEARRQLGDLEQALAVLEQARKRRFNDSRIDALRQRVLRELPG